MGLLEVLKRLPSFFQDRDKLVEHMKEVQPDAFIPIDFPDFNLSLAKYAKQLGIPVIYYICPQIWAWRKGRLKTIEKRVDLMLTIFPFEEALFTRIPAKYVGHPLIDEVGYQKRETRTPEKGKGTLAVLPGSRRTELKAHFPVLRTFFQLAADRYPDLNFIIPQADTLPDQALQDELSGLPPETRERIKVAPPGSANKVLSSSDAGLVASGTSTLQAALCGLPFALFYIMNPLSYRIGRTMVKVPYAGLVNLVAERELCREFLQEECQPEVLLSQAELLLWDEGTRRDIFKGLEEVQNKLGGAGASHRAAQEVMNYLKKNHSAHIL